MDPENVNIHPNLIYFAYLTSPNSFGFLYPLICLLRNEKMKNHLRGELQYFMISLTEKLRNLQKAKDSNSINKLNDEKKTNN